MENTKPISDDFLKSVRRRATFGVIALTSRTAVLQVVAFGSTFLLSIFLAPDVFGVFFLVSAVVSFLNYFSDIGLAAALVQKKEPITRIELKTTFSVQQILVVTVTIIALIFSDTLGRFYGLSTDGIWLFRSLIVSFFLASLKTIPSVLLERELDFNRLVIPQIAETVLFYGIAVILAWHSFGIVAFTYAVFARGLSGVIVMYSIAPWRPGFALDRIALSKLLSFGIPFQLNSFLALIKDDLFTLYLGKVLPFAQVGYIGWAKKWAEVPLRLLMDNIIKVTFPTYSRLQHHPKILKKAVEKVLFFLALFTLPMIVIMIFTIDPFIQIVPKYDKWRPALFSFYLFIISAGLSTITSPLTNVLNGIGKVKITLFFMVIWTIMTWTLIPLLIAFFGFNGVALGMMLISLTFVFVVAIVKRYVSFSLQKALLTPIVTVIPLITFLILSTRIINHVPFNKVLVILFSGIIWAGSVFVFARQEILILLQNLHNET